MQVVALNQTSESMKGCFPRLGDVVQEDASRSVVDAEEQERKRSEKETNNIMIWRWLKTIVKEDIAGLNDSNIMHRCA